MGGSHTRGQGKDRFGAPAVVAESQSIPSIVGACDKRSRTEKRPLPAWLSEPFPGFASDRHLDNLTWISATMKWSECHGIELTWGRSEVVCVVSVPGVSELGRELHSSRIVQPEHWHCLSF